MSGGTVGSSGKEAGGCIPWTPSFSLSFPPFKRFGRFGRVDVDVNENNGVADLDDTARFSETATPRTPLTRLAEKSSLKSEKCFFECADGAFKNYLDVVRNVLQMPIAAVCVCSDVQLHDARARRQSGLFHNRKGSSSCLLVPPAVERFYIFLPEIEDDVVVIENCRDDPRTKNSSVVVGPPYLRFYAGAVLKVNGVKVGALFVGDRAPRSDFVGEKKNTLMRLAAAASSMLQERAAARVASNNEAAYMMIDAMRNLQEPLRRASTALQDAPASPPRGAVASDSMLDLRKHVGHMQVAVDAVLCLGEFLVDSPHASSSLSPLQRRRSVHSSQGGAKAAAAAVAAAAATTTAAAAAGDEDDDASVSLHQPKGTGFAYCDVLAVIRDAQTQLQILDRIDDVDWVVDATKYLDMGNHIAPPRAVTWVLLAGVEQMLQAWKGVTVAVTFRVADPPCQCSDHLLAHQLEDEDEDEIWCNGVLDITFSVRGPGAVKRGPTAQMIANSSIFALVDGTCTISPGSENEADAAEVMKCGFPCAVLMNGDCHDIFASVGSSRKNSVVAKVPTSPPPCLGVKKQSASLRPDHGFGLDDVRLPATTETNLSSPHSPHGAALPRIAEVSDEGSNRHSF